MDDIQELFENVRSIIKQLDSTIPWEFSNFEWDKILACTDTIEDAQEVIKCYKNNYIRSSVGFPYLFFYGFFQAFILQQDALKGLCSILGISPLTTSQKIRDFRNDIVGHPTDRKNGSNVIRVIRSKLNQNTINYVIYSKKGSPQYKC